VGWAHSARFGRLLRRNRHSESAARGARFWGLAPLVVAWWLVIAAIVVATMPGPVASAPKVPLVVEPGTMAQIEQHGMRDWPIPVDRAAFDDLRRAYQESDQQAIERAAEATAWLTVAHHQIVQVVAVDGEAVQVLILEGDHAGRRGWLLTRHLSDVRR
jgi:hypothetical protein